MRATLSPKGAREEDFLISRCIQDCDSTNGKFDLLVGAITKFELQLSPPTGRGRKIF
jgi:hypothetical protein